MTTQPTTSLREQIIEAASDLTVANGWSGVTMGAIGTRLGVTRQVVQHEVGTKSDLGESLILWELGHFLEAVNAGFDAHPDDVVDAAREAIHSVLTKASVNPLLHAAVSATAGADTGLLPLLTTDSTSLSAAAAVVIEMRLGEYDHGIDPLLLGALVDTMVRLVVSHVIRPTSTPEETAELLAWIMTKVARPGQA